MLVFIIAAVAALLGALGILVSPHTRLAFCSFILFMFGALLTTWWLHAPLLGLLILAWSLWAAWLLNGASKKPWPEKEDPDRRYWAGLVAVLFTLAAYRIVLGSAWGQENYAASYLVQDFSGKNFLLEAGAALFSGYGLLVGVLVLFALVLCFCIPREETP